VSAKPFQNSCVVEYRGHRREMALESAWRLIKFVVIVRRVPRALLDIVDDLIFDDLKKEG